MSKNKLHQDTSILNLSWSALGSGILLSAMISFSTSVVASTQDLTLQQAIEQVNQYQASQNFWETQNSINATNLQQSKLFKNPELSVEQTGFGSNNEKELTIGISQPLDILALLQITTNGKLKTVLAKGAAYESFPWSAFSGRNHSLGCALVL